MGDFPKGKFTKAPATKPLRKFDSSTPGIFPFNFIRERFTPVLIPSETFCFSGAGV
jgi:hypothetical protein